jgi:hypothetical protein
MNPLLPEPRLNDIVRFNNPNPTAIPSLLEGQIVAMGPKFVAIDVLNSPHDFIVTRENVVGIVEQQAAPLRIARSVQNEGFWNWLRGIFSRHSS